jgi:zinc protease
MWDIKAITLDECLAYYRTHYAPNNAFVIVSGDVKPEKALKLVKEHFGRLKSEEPPPPVTTVEPEQRGEKRIDFHRAAQLSAVMAAYKIPAGNDPDIVPLLILAKILFDGESARLQKRLIYDEQMAVAVEGDAEVHNDPYLFYVYAQANVDSDIEGIKRIIFEETDRLAVEPVSDRELQKAKNRMESEFLLGLQSNVARADNIGMFQINTGDYENIYDYPARIQAVTVDDITRAAAKYLVPDHRTVVTLYPEEQNEEEPASVTD